MINSYPFISGDGHDWIFEGRALADRLAGIVIPPWPMVRNPLFVVIAMLDHLSGGGGGVLVLAYGLSYAVSLSALWAIGRLAGRGSGVIASVLLAFSLSPIVSVRFFVLSDHVCIALMMMSCVFIIKYIVFSKRNHLYFALGVSALAGLTETYGLVPFLIFSVWSAARLFSEKKFASYYYLFLLAILMFSVFFVQGLWRDSLPHLTRPAQFSLLAFRFDMMEFYANVWPIAFGLFIPAIGIGVVCADKSNESFRLVGVFLGMVVLSFASLSFFCQWREVRLTYIYFGIFMMFLLMLSPDRDAPLRARLSDLTLSLCALAVAASGALISCDNYWQPTLRGMSFNPGQTWIAQVLQAEPVDRLGLDEKCAGPSWICGRANFGSPADPYEAKMMKALSVLVREEEKNNDYFLAARRRQNALLIPRREDIVAAIDPSGQGAGHVDRVELAGGRLTIVGWGAEPALRRGAAGVWVVVEDQVRYHAAIASPRSDVTLALGLDPKVKPGFSISLPWPGTDPPSNGRVRLFVERENGTYFELPLR